MVIELYRYVFSGKVVPVCSLFLSFAKSFGGNANSTVAAIARIYDCPEVANDKTENEEIVSLSRYFGKNSFVVIETVSEFEPSYDEFAAILRRIGLDTEISLSVSRSCV